MSQYVVKREYGLNDYLERGSMAWFSPRTKGRIPSIATRFDTTEDAKAAIKEAHCSVERCQVCDSAKVVKVKEKTG